MVLCGDCFFDSERIKNEKCGLCNSNMSRYIKVNPGERYKKIEVQVENTEGRR